MASRDRGNSANETIGSFADLECYLEQVDVIVIGCGQGGKPLALHFAGLGKHVVLFERERLGGSCVNFGCTPSKAFLASAHNAGRARLAEPLGVRCAVRVDQRAVMARVRKIRDEWYDASVKKVGDSTIDFVHAEARFTGERVVSGGGRNVTAPLIIIDTGTSPTGSQTSRSLPITKFSKSKRCRRASSFSAADISDSNWAKVLAGSAAR